ncbi:type 1 fimbrial protein [Paraburkholderia aspalathi]|nr:type 1 fimbrial protein [Paraburkholderia aspalathi]
MTKRVIRYIVSLCYFVVALGVAPSFATSYNYSLTAVAQSPGTIQLNPTTPIGGILWQGTVTITSTSGTVYSYTQPGGFNGANTAQAPFATSISGVGLQVRYNPPGQPGTGAWWNAGGALGGTAIVGGTLDIQLIRTASTIGSGALGGTIGNWTMNEINTQTCDPACRGNIYDSSVTFTFSASVQATMVPTCSPATSSINVNLGSNILLTSFKGVGTTTTAVPFTISLNCSGGTGGTANISTTLTDNTNPANRGTTLSLVPGSATGAGIQVLYGSTLISYGADSSAAGNANQWYAGSSGNGTFGIQLTARYVQTGPVSAGSANGKATFTMSYQ